jgi:hypothetical protein
VLTHRVVNWTLLNSVGALVVFAACSSSSDSEGGYFWPGAGGEFDAAAGSGATSGWGGGGATGGAAGSGATSGWGGSGATGGAAGSGTGGFGAAGGSTAGNGGQTQSCGFNSALPGCGDCIKQQCATECANCTANPDCLALYDCIKKCSTSTCEQTCRSTYPNGDIDLMNFLSIQQGCVGKKCSAQCGGGGSGGGGGAGGASGSGNSGGAGGTISTDPFEVARNACVQRLNYHRAQHGVAPLQRASADREACADSQAKVDAQHGQAHWAFYNAPQCPGAAQTECGGHDPPPENAVVTCIDLLMQEGPGGPHYEIFLNPGYTKVACGFNVGASTGVWLPQNFY